MKYPFRPAEYPSPPTSREDRVRATALYHANLIQQRKDVEAQILAATEMLIDLPSSPNANPACPSLTDAATVKNSLLPFQPSDYDALIEERKINGRCGYVLCPRPQRQQETKAKYRVVYGKGKGPDALKFVEKGDLERWCSNDCGKRALYIKAQLNQEPAWTRRPCAGQDIVLLEDERNDTKTAYDQSSLAESMRDLDISVSKEQMIETMKALALERGDGGALSRTIRLAEVREKSTSDIGRQRAQPPEIGTHDVIEGYQSRFGNGGRRNSRQDEQEDIINTI